MSELLAKLETLGALEPLDTELARTLCRVGGECDEQVMLTIALASRHVREGHVCSELTRLAGSEVLNDEGDPTGVVFPSAGLLLDKLTASPVVGTSAAAHPLVLDASGRLYLARYFDHEQRVGALLAGLARETLPAPRGVSDAIAQLFPAPKSGVDLQREAALASRTRKLSVIVGGPGTGKTSTVVRLLALLALDAHHEGKPPPRVLLVAPTGKAAQRLSESISRARDKLPVEQSVRDAIPSTALTIHRALKPVAGSALRFSHGAANPLACDVLLLDEASMVDLALMRRLLEALPAHARLILLGDPDQLAAVEAGGVLTDICEAAKNSASPLAHCLSRLTQSYRYDASSGIAQLANAVHAQDPERALELLAAGLPDVAHFPSPKPTSSARVPLLQHAHKRYAGLTSGQLETRIAALDQYRVLTSHRRGPVGVEQLNPLLARAVHGDRRRYSEHYPGRPLLILQNDYASNLFNGDVGVEQPARRGGPLCAYFRDEAGDLRELSLSRLPVHESVYAMTVHKSQGSEFDEVAVVLPEKMSPILSRELLFTAITRARRSVALYASRDVLRATIARSITRSSGLPARLSG